MLILVSGAKMQLLLQLGVTDRQLVQTDSTTNPLHMRARGLIIRSCYSYGAVNVNQLAILTVNDIHSAGNPCDIRG